MDSQTRTLLRSPLRGAVLSVVATALFSMQDALVKWLSSDFSLLQLLFIRSIVAVPLLLTVLRYRFGWAGLSTNRPWDHVLRAFINLTAFLSYYFAISRMPLADAAAIAMAAPLFMAMLSGLVLAEYAGGRQILALLCGFAGVLLIIQPGGEQIDWLGVGAAILGTTMFALLAIQTRRMSSSETSELMVLGSAASFFVVTGCTMPFVWSSVAPTDFALMILLGIVSVSAQYSIVTSLRYAPVYLIGPLEYTGLLWAIFFGWLLFSDLPNALMLVGAILVIGSGLYILQSERSIQKSESKD
ncbi:MAG: DMT family transporter [Gammaproteobacteria bacterium]|nr:DMT family transporter [Gammaproteobacteria bacterium]